MDVSKSSVHMFGTKLEITLSKAEPGSWSKLDFPSKEKLPTPTTSQVSTQKSEEIRSQSDDEDDFNLDDIAQVTNGVQLSELARTKHN